MDTETLNRAKLQLKTGRPYSKVAQNLGITIREAEAIDIEHNGRFNYTPEGLGQPEMVRYLIARYDLRLQSEWDNTKPEIIKAREAYDSGQVEMATGRDGFFMLLYAIPRKEPSARPPYFSAPPEEF